MAPKREHVEKVLASLILVASIGMGGCAPSGMKVAISDNGAETSVFINYKAKANVLIKHENVFIKYKHVADISITRNVLFVIFDGLGSTDMQKYAEKLRDKYVAGGLKAKCIKRLNNIDKTREATIEANALGWVICIVSYSNSDSAAGRGGRNAFAAWTEQQGFPVIEFRCDDTWGNLLGNHVESNVTGILNIRGHTLFHKGPKITKTDLENPDTLYWDIYAPVNHLDILRDNDSWFIHQLVCVINGDDPFDPFVFALARACPNTGFLESGAFGDIQSRGDSSQKMVFPAHLDESPLNSTFCGRSGIDRQAGDVGFRGTSQAPVRRRLDSAAWLPGRIATGRAFASR